jgi:hypothetical protein
MTRVAGPLESIDRTPINPTNSVGEERFFTARGHFAGNPNRPNITQDVTYMSTNPDVASATNESARRGGSKRSGSVPRSFAQPRPIFWGRRSSAMTP